VHGDRLQWWLIPLGHGGRNLEQKVTKVTKGKLLQRDAYGNFTGFAPRLLPDDDGEVSGRLAGFMPQHEVTDKEALAARYLMQTMVANVEQSGGVPQWN
jgi:hypothetical protein